MPAGLRVWNAAGQLILDTNDRVSRIVGTLNLPDGHAAGSISNAAFGVGTPFAAVLLAERWDNSTGQAKTLTQASISGTTINYSAGDKCTIIYGTY